MNQHYGKLGDVWKHLPLAEILRARPPRQYWETHAGSAWYPLTESEPRRHGVLRFLERAPGHPGLCESAYLGVLQGSRGRYPGSAALARCLLGEKAGYVLCDIDPTSQSSLKEAFSGDDAQVVETDGVDAIGREAVKWRGDPGKVLVHIDPFDPYERVRPDARSPLELASWLAGQGYRVMYWYGYDESTKRGWARDEIAGMASGVELWCGDAQMPASFIYPDRRGAWGCGIVLANMTPEETELCRRMGRALEDICDDDRAPGNAPDRLDFRVIA